MSRLIPGPDANTVRQAINFFLPEITEWLSAGSGVAFEFTPMVGSHADSVAETVADELRSRGIAAAAFSAAEFPCSWRGCACGGYVLGLTRVRVTRRSAA